MSFTTPKHLFNNGGSYTLRTRDDRYDNILTANQLLLSRLNKSSKIADLRKTHVFFEKGHYVPFVNTVSDYTEVKSNGGALSISDEKVFKFTLPINGNFTSDIAIRVRLPELRCNNYLKYCNYLGIRLIKEIKFISSEFIIDRYNSDEALLYTNFNNDRERTNKLFGEQQVKQAYINIIGGQQVINYSDGLQCPKLVQPKAELLIPVLFDFCRSPEKALHNSFIINTQRIIEITLADIKDIIKEVSITDGLETELELSIKNIPIDLALMVNNLYIPEEIDTVVNNTMTHTLFRMRLYQKIPLQIKSKSTKIKFGQFKYAVENILLGARETNAPFNYWNLFGNYTDSNLIIPSLYRSGPQLLNLVQANAIKKTSLEPVIDWLRIYANSIEVVKQNSGLFFNTYVANKYGENLIKSSPDESCFMVNYSLNSKHQPSGYYNFTPLGSETFLEYAVVDGLDQNKTYELVVSMTALNFLVKDKDSIKLQFYR